MKKSIKCLSFCILLVGYHNSLFSETKAKFSLEEPQAQGKHVHQKVYYDINASFHAAVRLQCYLLHGADTTCLYNISENNVPFEKGTRALDIDFSKVTRVYTDNAFFDAFNVNNVLPPGNYKTILVIKPTAGDTIFTTEYYFEKDSILPYNSNLRNAVNSSLLPANKVRGRIHTPGKRGQLAKTGSISSILDRKLAQKKGLIVHDEVADGRKYVGFYYKDWFLGRYEIDDDISLEDKAEKETSMLSSNASSKVKGDLEGFSSVGSQIKRLYHKDRKSDEKVTGNIDLLSYFSNGTEPGSEQDRSYEEISGNIGTKVLGMPVQVEGYYTTQDIHRKVKASYLRLHYDVDESKGEVNEMIGSYRSKFGETASKGEGLKNIYSRLIAGLENEKKDLILDISKESGVDYNKIKGDQGNLYALVDTNGMMKKGLGAVDSSVGNNSAASVQKEKIRQDKEKLNQRIHRLQETDKKIEKYKRLIAQYNDQSYFDSVMNYSKVEKLRKYDDPSYKKMCKAASGLLPDGKVSRFLTGITNLDVGIINKYESDYTISGQTVKGGSLGYDLGFARVGVVAGSTEYASRDGGSDKYSSYMARMGFDPVLKQNISVVYYLYSPTKAMFQDEQFFKRSDVAVATFRKPTHIISLTDDGTIGKHISIHEEGALSYKSGQDKFYVSMANSAIKSSVEYNIPSTNAVLSGEWEHIGKLFTNSSLPYSKSATERYTFDIRSDLFHSFLSVGVQYNFIKQENFASTGHNTKWGFDLKTHSKRWPNVSLSYRPYSTFRRFDDTLNIQQRPINGSVGTGSVTYQCRRNGYTHRFLLIFNENRSNIDTIHYNSKTLQFNYILAKELRSLFINAGWIDLPAQQFKDDVPASNYFAGISANGNINDKLSVVLGEDVNWVAFGLQKTNTSLGGQYRFARFPLMVRGLFRFGRYRQGSNEQFKSLLAGQVGITYKLESKVRKR